MDTRKDNGHTEGQRADTRKNKGYKENIMDTLDDWTVDTQRDSGCKEE